jgi:hypothetical protein
MTTHSFSLTRFWPLLALVAIALFPFGWLAELWPAFDTFAGALFPTVVAHAIGHSIIFFLVGVALLMAFPQLRNRPWLYIGLLVMLALGQETFQLAYKQRPIEFDEFRDFVTDLIGGLGALYLMSRMPTKPGYSEKQMSSM